MDQPSVTPSPLVRKLRHGAALSEEDEQRLAAFATPVQQVAARQDIAAEGHRPHSLPLILDGWACRYHDLPDGRRQIIGLFLPGDLCEPFGALPRLMDHSIGTLTAVSYVRVRASALRDLARSSSAVEQALWWDALISADMMHERAVSLGQRSAFERLAHLVCELHLRLTLVGLADEIGFDFPLTQQDLGHMLGLSSVHVNRSLQALRGTGFVSVRGRRLTIIDLAGLRDVALFEPGFLHLRGTASD